MAKVLIDLEDSLYEECKVTKLTEENEGVLFHLVKCITSGMLLPDNATNGDIIQNICSMWIEYHDTDIEVTVSKEDWNAPYGKVRTTRAGDIDGKIGNDN